MPTSTEIVEHVYDGIVLPVIEASVAKSLGIVGTPLLWIYRRTIGGCVRFLIVRMKAISLTPTDKNEVERAADEFMSELAEDAPHVKTNIQQARQLASGSGSMLRRILYSIQLIFLLVAVAAVVPLGLFWYWTR